jgi:putative FmdB family regulatory protein
MPTYDYVCSRCGDRVEVVHGIHGQGPAACPSCGAEGTMGKAFVPPVIHFKGSGWAKKDRSATSTSGKTRTGSTPAAGSGSATATEARPATDEPGAGSTKNKATDGAAGTSGD